VSKWQLHSEALRNLYLLSNIMNLNKSRILNLFRLRWKDDIEMDFCDVGWNYVRWICVTQMKDLRLVVVNAVINLWAKSNSGNFLTILATVCFSKLFSSVKLAIPKGWGYLQQICSKVPLISVENQPVCFPNNKQTK